MCCHICEFYGIQSLYYFVYFVQEGEEFLKKQKTSICADHQEEVEAQ